MQDFRGKKIIIMGLGLHGGGVEIVKFFAKTGAKLIITDLRSKKDLLPSLERIKNLRNIHYVLGRHRVEDFLSADLIVKNPGVKPDSPYLLLANKRHIPVISELGIFFRFCPARIIGVTGTRGKSTTAYLIWKFLQTKNKRVFLGGNIRKSALAFLPRLKKSDVVILEISSFQLQDLSSERTIIPGFPPLLKRSPDIAVLTNIMRDHLNWHSNFAEYIKAKENIFVFQKKNDLLFLNLSDQLIRKIARKALSKVIAPKLPVKFSKIVKEKLGGHYFSSIALAIAVARHLGTDEKSIKSILKSFRGLEGREEHLGKVKGTNFINDTTATMPDATIAALKRFREIAGLKQLILIAGGTDKKLDFKEMARSIKKMADCLILLPGSASDKIKKRLKDYGDFKEARSMEEAVRLAYRAARSGDYIILSPGAASFGLFLNEFDRGDKFVDAVSKLKS